MCVWILLIRPCFMAPQNMIWLMFANSKTAYFERFNKELCLLYFISSWATLWLSLLLLLLDYVICFIKYIMKLKCQTCSKIQRLLLKWKCFRNEHTLWCCYMSWVGSHCLYNLKKNCNKKQKREKEEALPWSHMVNALL